MCQYSEGLCINVASLCILLNEAVCGNFDTRAGWYGEKTLQIFNGFNQYSGSCSLFQKEGVFY